MSQSAGNMIVCDVGNSRAALGLVDGGQIVHVVRVPLEALEDLAAMLQATPDAGGLGGRAVLISSVNPAGAAKVSQLLQSAGAGEVRLAGRDFKVPLAVSPLMPQPERIGQDRLLAALGAWRRSGRAAVVVDVGTAITVDSVDDAGVYQGGAILPGLATAAWSLRARTAVLPEIPLAGPVAAVGRDTESAIRTGLVLGAAGAVDRLVEEQLRLLPAGAGVYITGGGYELLRPHLKNRTEAVAELVLEGLVGCAAAR